MNEIKMGNREVILNKSKAKEEGQRRMPWKGKEIRIEKKS